MPECVCVCARVCVCVCVCVRVCVCDVGHTWLKTHGGQKAYSESYSKIHTPSR